MATDERIILIESSLADNSIVNYLPSKRSENDKNNLEWQWKEDQCSRLLSFVYDDNNEKLIGSDRVKTGARGNQELAPNRIHYWEIKLSRVLFMFDMRIGVTRNTDSFHLNSKRSFVGIGHDQGSWAYLNQGTKKHNNLSETYGEPYGFGSIIGVELDMFRRTLQFYCNGKPQGIAYKGIEAHEKTPHLVPAVSSFIPPDSLTLTTAISESHTLQYLCIQVIASNKAVRQQYEEIPQIKRLFDKKYFWIMNTKRKAKTIKTEQVELKVPI